MFLAGAIVVKNNWLRRIRRFVSNNHALIPGTVAAAISVGMWQLGIWQPLERMAYNWMFQVRTESSIIPHRSWDERVAVIAIDDASLKKYGKFPWRRERYVDLLKTLEKSPPAAIGFDILFVDPGKGDRKFASAIASSGNVVLPMAWDEQGHPLEVIPEFEEVAANIGQIWHTPDDDGISRQTPIFFGKTPALGLAMLQVAAGESGVRSPDFGLRENNERGSRGAEGQNKELPFSSVSPLVSNLSGNLLPSKQPIALRLSPEGAKLPELAKGKRREDVWINWPGATKDVRTFSYADVIEGKVPASTFAGKFVLVGVTATAADTMRSPLDQNPPTSGVYLHAAIVDNLLNNRLLHSPRNRWVIILLLSLGPTVSWLLYNRSVLERATIAILLPSAWIIFSLSSFMDDRWLLPLIAPAGTMIIAGVGMQIREQYEKQEMMSLFAKHVAPETAKVIWQRKDEIIQNGKLQAQETIATVLFCDIRGFTTISEKLPPCELLDWLNRYLDAMTDCIMDRGGVIDKYIGDAIMAVFGIPFVHTDPEAIKHDAHRAIAAAIAMQKRLKRLNRQLQAEGKPTIEIGIGIHTGLVVAGSVGGKRRLNYSVLGDTVNVAARLEPMNKEVKGDNPYKLIVSGKTFAHVCDRYDAYQVGTTQLRGREQQTTIYCILGKKKKQRLPQPEDAIAPKVKISV